MKGKVKFAAVAVFLAVFVAMFAGEAAAANRPSWLGWKFYTEFERTPNVSNINSPNYWRLKISVTHTNNSTNRIVTAIFNKSLTVTATGARDNKASVKSTRVNETNLYPGQSQTLYYYVSVGDLMGNLADWRYFNQRAQQGTKNVFSRITASYDCQVRTQNL
jgi:hypothetical protein